ncbi:MAG TPA: acyl-CoA thioesterase [Clostridiales bacterium]|nr:acyl-CoA thioesterase [Clostridiales bacterium]
MNVQPFIRKANYYETDQMGIIHHSNYIRYFEEARIHFMNELGFGYDKVVAGGVDIAVLEVRCRYKTMVRYGDTMRIHVTIKELTPARLVVGYRIEDNETGELKTTGESTHCFLSCGEHRVVRLSKTLPELYGLFEQCATRKQAEGEA